MRSIFLFLIFCNHCTTVNQIKIQTKGESKLKTLIGTSLPERTIFLYFTSIDSKTEISSSFLMSGNLEALEELWRDPPMKTDPFEHRNHYAILLALRNETEKARDILQIHYSKLDKEYYFENIDSLRLLLQNS